MPPGRPESYSRPQSGSFCLSGHDRYGRFLRDVQGSVQIGIVKDRPQASNYYIRSKNSTQVRLTKDQHSIQALAAHGADQAFRIAILPWRSRRDRLVADPHGPHPGPEDMSVGTVIFFKQKTAYDITV